MTGQAARSHSRSHRECLSPVSSNHWYNGQRSPAQAVILSGIRTCWVDVPHGMGHGDAALPGG